MDKSQKHDAAAAETNFMLVMVGCVGVWSALEGLPLLLSKETLLYFIPIVILREKSTKWLLFVTYFVPDMIVNDFSWILAISFYLK